MKYIISLITVLISCSAMLAKDYDITLSSNADGAAVYLNGQKRMSIHSRHNISAGKGCQENHDIPV